MGKRVSGTCNGKGVEYREVKESVTGYWTKQEFKWPKWQEAGVIDCPPPTRDRSCPIGPPSPSRTRGCGGW